MKYDKDVKIESKWKFKSISLKNSSYAILSGLTKTLVPGMKLSCSQVIEFLINREIKKQGEI